MERDQNPTRSSQQRDQVARILSDPEGYFAEARRWARRKAQVDVQQELAEAAAAHHRDRAAGAVAVHGAAQS